MSRIHRVALSAVVVVFPALGAAGVAEESSHNHGPGP